MRILVVEDEKEIRDFIVKTLRAECYVVDSAEDGETCLELIKENSYDLLILDNMMPKRSGLFVCEELRKQNNNVPILVVSVRSEATTKVDLLNAGADDYLTKPFSVDELLARIKALLRRPKQLEKEIYEIDDLKFDAATNHVTRGGLEIVLTRKELALLKYLLRNQGSVLSRSMIMEHVWDMNADPFSNTIESHIMSLRKKVDMEGKTKLIHTVAGRGYKIDAI